MSPAFVRFVLNPTPVDRKTPSWKVVSAVSTSGSHLGVVKFYGAWRKFGFFPAANTIFEEVCLRDIAAFCEAETRTWRATAKQSRKAPAQTLALKNQRREVFKNSCESPDRD